MYKKIYEYLIDIEEKERESYHENIRNFIEDYESGFEDYKEIGKRLTSLLEENKKFEELEDMENFLWKKVYEK
jgi:hypothetical protein